MTLLDALDEPQVAEALLGWENCPPVDDDLYGSQILPMLVAPTGEKGVGARISRQAVLIARKVAAYEAVAGLQEVAQIIKIREPCGTPLADNSDKQGVMEYRDADHQNSKGPQRSFSLDTLNMDGPDLPNPLTTAAACLDVIATASATTIGWYENDLVDDFGIRLGKVPRCFSVRYLDQRQFVPSVLTVLTSDLFKGTIEKISVADSEFEPDQNIALSIMAAVTRIFASLLSSREGILWLCTESGLQLVSGLFAAATPTASVMHDEMIIETSENSSNDWYADLVERTPPLSQVAQTSGLGFGKMTEKHWDYRDDEDILAARRVSSVEAAVATETIPSHSVSGGWADVGQLMVMLIYHLYAAGLVRQLVELIKSTLRVNAIGSIHVPGLSNLRIADKLQKLNLICVTPVGRCAAAWAVHLFEGYKSILSIVNSVAEPKEFNSITYQSLDEKIDPIYLAGLELLRCLSQTSVGASDLLDRGNYVHLHAIAEGASSFSPKELQPVVRINASLGTQLASNTLEGINVIVQTLTAETGGLRTLQPILLDRSSLTLAVICLRAISMFVSQDAAGWNMWGLLRVWEKLDIVASNVKAAEKHRGVGLIVGSELAETLEVRRSFIAWIISLLEVASDKLAELQIDAPASKQNGSKDQLRRHRNSLVNGTGSSTPKVGPDKAGVFAPMDIDDPANRERMDATDSSKNKSATSHAIASPGISLDDLQTQSALVDLIEICVCLVNKVTSVCYDVGVPQIALGTTRECVPIGALDENMVPYVQFTNELLSSKTGRDLDRMSSLMRPVSVMSIVTPGLLKAYGTLERLNISRFYFAGGALATASIVFGSGANLSDLSESEHQQKISPTNTYWNVLQVKQMIVSFLKETTSFIISEVSQTQKSTDIVEAAIRGVARLSVKDLTEDRETPELDVIVVPHYFEPPVKVIDEILNGFMWESTENILHAAQLLNDLLPSCLPIVQTSSEDDENEDDLTVEDLSRQARALRIYWQRNLVPHVGGLCKAIRVLGATSTRELHLATRALVCQLVDLDLEDVGVARSILSVIVEELEMTYENVKAVVTPFRNRIIPETGAPLDEDLERNSILRVTTPLARWLSILSAATSISSGKAYFLMCSSDTSSGIPFAERIVPLLLQLPDLLSTGNIVADLGLEILASLCDQRLSLLGGDYDEHPQQNNQSPSEYVKAVTTATSSAVPSDSTIAKISSTLLEVITRVKDVRLQLQIILFLVNAFESNKVAEVVCTTPHLHGLICELADWILRELLSGVSDKTRSMDPVAVEGALQGLTFIRMVLDRSGQHSEFEWSPLLAAFADDIRKYEWRLQQLKSVSRGAAEIAQSTANSFQLQQQRMAERGTQVLEDEEESIIDPMIFTTISDLAEYIGEILSSPSGTAAPSPATGVDGMGGEAKDLSPLKDTKNRGSQKLMMLMKRRIIISSERYESLQLFNVDEESTLLWEVGDEPTDLYKLAKEVLPPTALEGRFRMFDDSNNSSRPPSIHVDDFVKGANSGSSTNAANRVHLSGSSWRDPRINDNQPPRRNSGGYSHTLGGNSSRFAASSSRDGRGHASTLPRSSTSHKPADTTTARSAAIANAVAITAAQYAMGLSGFGVNTAGMFVQSGSWAYPQDSSDSRYTGSSWMSPYDTWGGYDGRYETTGSSGTQGYSGSGSAGYSVGSGYVGPGANGFVSSGAGGYSNTSSNAAYANSVAGNYPHSGAGYSNSGGGFDYPAPPPPLSSSSRYRR
ncbi:hypothetical protein HDU93_005154 [Gonapodya sp. JEL0774]|nr:hypothetical protein HDU93_005154 [Gonapodya sp. JEL0774]